MHSPSNFCSRLLRLFQSHHGDDSFFDLSIYVQEFWNWNWDDLVSKDLPSMLYAVYNHTQQPLFYVGYSQVRACCIIQSQMFVASHLSQTGANYVA